MPMSVRYAYERVERGLPMPGVVEVPQRLPIGAAVEQLELLATVCTADEFDGLVRFLPM